MFDTRCIPLTRFAAACWILLAATPAGAQESISDPDSMYAEAMAAGLYAEAETAAKQRLDLAIRDGRRNDLATAALFTDLAAAQREGGDHATALQNYDLAVEVVEANTDMLNIGLAEPLVGIATTHLLAGRPDLAVEPLERALHVHAVNDGPHSLGQARALEVLADVYLAMGEHSDAVDVADRLVILYGRNYPGASMEIVPALLRKGEILRAALEWREERNAYHDAISIIEKVAGKDSPRLAPPLVGLGKSHQAEYFHLYLQADAEEELPDTRLLDRAEGFFEDALEYARNAPAAEWRAASEAMLASGDFYILTKEPVRARRYFREAWEFLSADSERLQLRAANLEAVVPLLQPAPDLTGALPFDADPDAATASFDTGYIVTRFAVNRRGRPTDIGLVEIAPERNAAIEAEIKRVLTQFVYRPVFANGMAVDSGDQLLRYEFPVPAAAPAGEQ